MQKSNQMGFAILEAVLIVIVLVLVAATGWYVWHGRQVKKVTDYNSCIKAGGQRFDPTIIGAESDCKIYGMTFTDPGKINWEVGQRYTDITHKDTLQPAKVTDKTGDAPAALITLLKKDNGGCAVGSPATSYNQPAFTILKVVDDKYALLNYGCVTDSPSAYNHTYMFVLNTSNGWREISPTNEFDSSGVPACALVNHFGISKQLVPKCTVGSDQYQRYENNINP